MELNPRDAEHWPFIGSVVDYVDGDWPTGARPRSPVPRNLVLPWAFSSQRVGEVARAGPYGGFLGRAYDPICTEFVGQGTTKARKTLAEQGLGRRRAVSWDHSREPVSAGGGRSTSGPELTLDRLDRRRTLLEQIEQLRRDADARRATARASTAIARWPTTCSARSSSARRSTWAGAGRDARPVRHDPLRPGGLDRAPAGRGRRPVHHRLLGRVRPGRHRLGHALGPLPPHERRAACRASIARFRGS